MINILIDILCNRTNNQLQSTNQKITQVATKFSRLDKLFEGTFH